MNKISGVFINTLKGGFLNFGSQPSGCFLIAEAGVNHNGSLKIAKQLIDAAFRAGADAVKFQSFRTEEIVTPRAPKADYQKKYTGEKSQFDMLKKLEFSEEQFLELVKYAKKKGIMFLSTPFDAGSADFLYGTGMPIFKISSGDLTNIPFLRHVAAYKKPVILSTGMSTLEEIREAVKAVYSKGNRRLTLLHCTSNYPAEYKDVNLRAMETLSEKFKLPIGYSDHTRGIEVSVAAAAMGARVVEKHFTLDRKLPGPDHKASLEPGELGQMIQCIRNIEKAMGDGVKKPVSSEDNIKKIARKSIVACCDIPKGTKITEEMLAVKRPGTGILPGDFNKVIGKKTVINIKKDNLIRFKDLT
jgi:N,N'-diacetyllegionaminate synthase